MERKHTYDRTEINRTLRDMSLEEKVNQMSQVTGGFFNGKSLSQVLWQIRDLQKTMKSCRISHRIHGRETLKSIQKNYMESIRTIFHWLFMLDVINGYKTGVSKIQKLVELPLNQLLSEQCASVAKKGGFGQVFM